MKKTIKKLNKIKKEFEQILSEISRVEKLKDAKLTEPRIEDKNIWDISKCFPNSIPDNTQKMTPKEKAEELLKKMYLAKGGYIYPMHIETARQCTLIAVEEILSLFQDKSPIVFNYWQDVKKELGKI